MADDDGIRRFLESEAPTGPPVRDPDIDWVQAPDGSWQQTSPEIRAARRAAEAQASRPQRPGRSDDRRNFLIVCGVLVAILLVVVLAGLTGKGDSPAASPATTTRPALTTSSSARPSTTRRPAVTSPPPEPAPSTSFVPPTTAASPRMSMAEFNQIQTGQSYDYVVTIVGGPGVLASQTQVGDYSGAIYTWDGEGGTGANALVQFQNGLVIGKSQAGLR